MTRWTCATHREGVRVHDAVRVLHGDHNAAPRAGSRRRERERVAAWARGHHGRADRVHDPGVHGGPAGEQLHLRVHRGGLNASVKKLLSDQSEQVQSLYKHHQYVAEFIMAGAFAHGAIFFVRDYDPETNKRT